MGILRTDKISGLETPTAVTGSVEFDGTGKAVSFPAGNDFAYGTGDFTIEGWFYPTVIGTVSGAGYAGHIFFGQTVSGTNYLLFGIDANGKLLYYSTSAGGGSDRFSSAPDGSVVLNQWQHIALCRSSGTTKAFVDGQEIISISDTFDFTNTDRNPTIGNYTHTLTTQPFNGYVSNFRILKGTALYTSDFTVPTHELEVIGDTVLLCCNNPDSAGAEATGKAATVSGSAPASTFSPGLTKDFTFGTEFKGVTTFDTQGYFVPPSGTTTERYPTGTGGAGAGTRGVMFGGYYDSSPNRSDVIDYVTIASTGNAVDFGDRLNTTDTCAACASATRALNAGGYDGSATINTIEYVTIASTGNAVDFGDTRIARRNRDGCASSTRGLFGGGYPIDDAIDYVTIATQGTSVYFGNLTSSRYNLGGLSSPTRGVFAGGQPANGDTIDYVTIATTGDAVDFGNLTASSTNTKGASSTTRGIFGHNTNVINYITIASLGDAQDFGDLNYNPNANTCTSSLIRGVFMGGGSPTTINTISYITIASTGDAVDFGDLTQARQSLSATSSGHGGLG